MNIVRNNFELVLVREIVGDGHIIKKSNGSLFHHGVHPQIGQFKNCIISLEDSPFIVEFEEPISLFYCSTSSYEEDTIHVTGYKDDDELIGDDSAVIIAPAFDNVLLAPIDVRTGKRIQFNNVKLHTGAGNTGIFDNFIIGVD